MAAECVDCASLPLGQRPAKPRPTNGRARAPRCYTHANDLAKRQKAAKQANHWQKTYGLSAADYKQLYDFQGGKCAVCRVATGASKALAVDHDHACCPGPLSCGQCVRGLLCGICNRIVLGRYGPEALGRAILYLSGGNPATQLRAKGDWPVR